MFPAWVSDECDSNCDFTDVGSYRTMFGIWLYWGIMFGLVTAIVDLGVCAPFWVWDCLKIACAIDLLPLIEDGEPRLFIGELIDLIIGSF